MTHDVSSWFVEQALEKSSTPVRKFLMVGGNILSDPEFYTACGVHWECGTGWSISGNKATHGAGTGSSDIGENLGISKIASKTFEVTFTLSNRTAGSVRPKFTGGTAVYGTYRSADGTYTETIVTNEDNFYFNLSASVTFAGDVSDLIVKEVTANYSDRVLSWPSFGVKWDDIKPVRVNLNLANEDQALNFLKSDKTNMQNSCTLQMGFVKYGKLTIANSGDYSTIPNSSSGLETATDSDCTFEVMVTPTANGNPSGRLFLRGSPFTGLWSTFQQKFGFHSINSGGVIDGSVSDSSSYSLNQAYHLVGRQSVNSSFVDLWKNGSLVASDALDGTPRKNYAASDEYTVGGDGTYYQSPGHVHFARLYSRAISDTECAEHYTGIYNDESNLEGHWGFNEVGQNSFSDLSGNGVHGSIQNLAELAKDVDELGVGIEELVDLFNGKIDTISMVDGTIRLTLADKFRQLSERIIGTSNSPQDYTSSNHLVSDLAWYICTSHGGLDATESSSNVDIDYDSFSTWAGVMSGDTVVIQGRFTGTKVLEALRKIARTTHTAIYQEENRIHFQRFNFADSHDTELGNDEIKSLEVTVDGNLLTNKKLVMFDYDITSRYHKETVVEQDSASVNSFGLRENVEKDASLWFVNSQSAINAAQRDVLIHKTPYDRVVVKTPLVGLLRTVGEMISVTDPHLEYSSETFRIMKRSVSMNDGTVTFNGDASQIFGGFTLNTSLLDGPDALI